MSAIINYKMKLIVCYDHWMLYNYAVQKQSYLQMLETSYENMQLFLMYLALMLMNVN